MAPTPASNAELSPPPDRTSSLPTTGSRVRHELPEEENGDAYERPAESAPSLPEADEAWVCVYGDSGAPADGSRGYYVWKRAG